MKKCFIFAHYDKNNEIKPYIIDEINLLNRLGDVLFISDCEYISNLNQLPKVKYLQVSRHYLYDAHSYMCGFNYLRFSKQLNNYDNITFVNSSIIFPICDELMFTENISQMDNNDEKVYGMCKTSFLLQSYWITCKKDVYNLLEKFFDDYIPATCENTRKWWNESDEVKGFKKRYARWYNSRVKEVGEELSLKWIYTVAHFEEGLSRYLYKNGIKLVALDYGCWPNSRFITKVPREKL